jgi:hypothetical protein
MMRNMIIIVGGLRGKGVSKMKYILIGCNGYSRIAEMFEKYDDVLQCMLEFKGKFTVYNFITFKKKTIIVNDNNSQCYTTEKVDEIIWVG